MQFKAVLQELERWFQDHRFPFAVIGGLALHAYGISRPTYDLDLITVGEAQGPVIAHLEALGYETLHRSAGFSNHQHTDPAQGRIDLLYVREETATQLFADARPRTLFATVTVPILRPEHLIALKLHAMHNDSERELQELADIRALIEVPEIDPDLLRQTFRRRREEALYERLRNHR